MPHDGHVIALSMDEVAGVYGWSLDRDWPLLASDEVALQDRLRAILLRKDSGSTKDESR